MTTASISSICSYPYPKTASTMLNDRAGRWEDQEGNSGVVEFTGSNVPDGIRVLALAKGLGRHWPGPGLDNTYS